MVMSYEDNATNVGVYANRISSCNLNHYNGNMLCINRDYESVIQYHDVDSVTFCPYHYCVRFRTQPNMLACTGYVYLKMSSGMGEYINPLTPDHDNIGFTGNPSDEYIKIGSSFEGYNILIDRFEQSVETEMEKPITGVQCEDPVATCISLSDGTEKCFGGTGLMFNDVFVSVILGLIVPGALSFTCYIILSFVKHRFARNGCVTKILVPLIVESSCMLILFVASNFIVKVLPFLIASLVGIFTGHIVSELVKTVSSTFIKKYRDKRVDNEYGAGRQERAGMLRNKNDEEKMEDGVMTEIELATT